jgi:hypothetical protein
MKFIQQAYKGDNEWWAYILTLFLFVFGWQLIGIIPLGVTAYLYAGSTEEFITASTDAFTSLGINSNLYLLLMIFMFFAGLVFLLIGIKFVHKRTVKSVLTSREKLDWNRILFAFIAWFSLGIIVFGIDYFISPNDYVWNFQPIPFIILVVISFLFLPLQTSMEEVLFRGYLMQGFGTWFKSAFAALILTSVIFGLMHGANPEVEKLGWIIMVYYIGTGLVLGIFTIMDEGTELSLGFHAANNIMAAIMVTNSWAAFQTEALFVDISEPKIDLEFFLPLLVFYPLIIIIISKKYGWKNWKEKMFKRVMKPVEFDEDKFIA